MTNQELLEELAEDQGCDVMSMLEEATFDSVVPCICTECLATTDGEPDLREGHCDSCGSQTVRSCLDLAGVI